VFSAIYGKSLDVVKLFVERGADLNAVFGEETIGVIGYRENHGTPEIVGFLKGGDRGKTPSDGLKTVSGRGKVFPPWTNIAAERR
jgi:hypothetical protein